MILTPLLKLPKNVEDLGKLIVAKGLKKLPKVKKIATSGHTAGYSLSHIKIRGFSCTLAVEAHSCFVWIKMFVN